MQPHQPPAAAQGPARCCRRTPAALPSCISPFVETLLKLPEVSLCRPALSALPPHLGTNSAASPCPPCPPGQTIARRIPAAAYFTTLAIRFANNVVGGENFIDMARWAGVQ